MLWPGWYSSVIRARLGRPTKGFGNLLILSGVLCCALYSVLAQRARHVADPLTAVTLQQSFALLWALALLPIEASGTDITSLLRFDGDTWLWAILSGIIYYALAFWFYLYGLARVNAAVAGQFINLIPIFGVGTAYFVLAERLAPNQWVGACAIVIAVFAIFTKQDQTIAIVGKESEGR
ncbi:MAG: DMT family transporter [Caldilineaceae bacterium]